MARPSPLSRSKNWPGGRHQVCVFHFLQEANQEVMPAFWTVYRQVPTWRRRRRGRPSTRGCPRQARFDKRQCLWEHRFLLLRRPDHLTQQERKAVRRMVAIAPTRAILRQVVEELHRLFD